MRTELTRLIGCVVIFSTLLAGCILPGLPGGISGLEGPWGEMAEGIAGEVAEGIAKAAVQSLEDGEVAEEYTADQQYYIGRGVSAAILSKFEPVVDDNELHTQQIVYVNEMGGYIREATLQVTRDDDRLGGHISRDDTERQRIDHLYLFRGLHVGILDTDDVMAFATPGGFIWISRGSIEMCQNEDELAAIVCHELGHVVMDHGMDNYREANEDQIQDNPLFASTVGALPGNFGNLIGGFADDLIDAGYSQDQEYEADNWGTRALAEAGYDPQAMVRMLKNVEIYEKAHEDDEEAGYLSNHPDVEDRIKAVEELIDEANLKAGAATMTPAGQSSRGARFNKLFKE